MTTAPDQPLPVGRTRASRLPSSTGSRDNLNQVARHHRLIIAETYHDFGDDLSNQPGVIALVGVNGTVEPFQYFSFHRSEIARG